MRLVLAPAFHPLWQEIHPHIQPVQRAPQRRTLARHRARLHALDPLAPRLDPPLPFFEEDIIIHHGAVPVPIHGHVRRLVSLTRASGRGLVRAGAGKRACTRGAARTGVLGGCGADGARRGGHGVGSRGAIPPPEERPSRFPKLALLAGGSSASACLTSAGRVRTTRAVARSLACSPARPGRRTHDGHRARRRRSGRV